MASYGATSAKRQKQAAEVIREATQARAVNADTNELVTGIAKIDYQAEGSIDETLKYRYYHATERIQGRTFEDWIRPAVSLRSVLSQTEFDFNGDSTVKGTWNDVLDMTERQKRRLRAAFEVFTKLGVKFWTLTDTDLLYPGGDILEDSQGSLDEILDFIQDLHNRSNLKLLSYTVDFEPVQRNYVTIRNASDPASASYVGARLKRGLDIAQRLGAENYVIRGEREGFNSVLNTDIGKEIRHFSYFLKMVADYKKRIGYRGQLLLEPSDSRSEERLADRDEQNQVFSYRYTRDAFSTQTFLRQYGLERFYKLNLRPNMDSVIASLFGILGSITVHGSGAPDLREATLFMKSTLEQGGLQPGGLSMSLRPSRNSSDMKDLFIVYVNALDTFARALRIAVKMNTDGLFTKNLRQRYQSFSSGWGNRFASGEANLEACEEEYRKSGRANATSGRSEHWETVFNRYLTF